MNASRKKRSNFIKFNIYFALNAISLCLYLYFAALIWAPASEKGLYGGPGDPILWGAFAFPFLFLSTLLNFFVFVSSIVRAILYQRWKFFLLVCCIVITWCAAFEYDASRQFDGSWVQSDAPVRIGADRQRRSE